MGKVLVLCHNIYPLMAGDALYNYGLVREISKIKDTKIFSYIEDGVDTTDYELKDITSFYRREYATNKDGLRAHYARIYSLNKDMLSDVCSAIESHDVDSIIVIHIVMALYARELKKRYPDIKLYYVSQNVEAMNKKLFDRYEASLKKRSFVRNVARSILKAYEMSCHKYYEKQLVCDYDGYLSVSREDIVLHRKLYGELSPAYFAKPIIEFPCNKTEDMLDSFNKKLLIVGSMSWFPNVEGIIWFVNNVMTKLISEGYKLYVVGGSPAEAIVDIGKKYPDNVIVTGRVPTVDEYFEECDISIVPLFKGTGAKIKVLESIARGIPTISTTYAAKDYDIKDELMLADDSDRFIECIHMLEADALLRKALYKRTQDYYKRYMKLDNEIVRLL